VESCKLRYFNSFEFFDHTRDVKQWNVSFVPLIDRLTTEGGVSYFLVPGNHEGTATDVGMKNYLDAVGTPIPEESSPRRLKGHTTFSFGYGNTFVIGLDANIAGDEAQYNWTKAQLEGARSQAIPKRGCVLSSSADVRGTADSKSQPIVDRDWRRSVLPSSSDPKSMDRL
jgi:hypothetical protein